ncbi:MAG: hypothetical protein K2X66_05155, partial [Cyanobacteria bacterium]|nr:hypothetical protein [Cyanobacteriota bacterium]
MSELPNSKEPVLNSRKPKRARFGLPDWISKFLFSGLQNNQQPLLKLLVVLMFVMSFFFSLPDIVSYFERFEHYSFDERQSNFYENRSQSGISLLEMDEISL